MTEQHKKESLNRAYVLAVAAKAGLIWAIPQQDYGTDIHFQRITKRGERLQATGIALNCQLKASKDWRISDDGTSIIYDLEAKTFNDLADDSALCALILLCLPSPMDEWLEMCEDYLLIRKCCYYWINENRETTNNVATKTIYIPKYRLS
jgi:Domain of unknown function (DUF4365)